MRAHASHLIRSVDPDDATFEEGEAAYSHTRLPAPKGRGAQSNATSRFERCTVEVFDDGWGSAFSDGADAWAPPESGPEGDDSDFAADDFGVPVSDGDGAEHSPDVGKPQSTNKQTGSTPDKPAAPKADEAFQPKGPLQLKTTVQIDHARRVISRNTSPDIPFDRSINPYKGCEHGCVYCFARPTHAYLGLSAGLDFESKIFTKPNAAELLKAELAAPSYRARPIAMGTNTDPYQPVEKRMGITRSILEVLNSCNHPLTIVTKSRLILRDLDILADMAKRRLVKVAVSVTSLDAELCRTLEPRASTPARRLDTIQQLAAAGVPTGVMVAPVIPALTDHELEAIVEACAQAGASWAAYIYLRLPLEVAGLFDEWLSVHAPDRRARVLAQVSAVRGGKLNVSTYGERFRGAGEEARLFAKRFMLACERSQLSARSRSSIGETLDGLTCDAFVPPANTKRRASGGRAGGTPNGAQLSLF